MGPTPTGRSAMESTHQLDRHEAALFLDELRRDISAAQLRVSVDKKLGRITPTSIKKLASLPEPPVIQGAAAPTEHRERRAGSERRAGREAGLDEMGLTEREDRIARLLLSGLSTKEIAADMQTFPRQIEGATYQIYLKLGIRRRDELRSAYEALGKESLPDSSRIRGF